MDRKDFFVRLTESRILSNQLSIAKQGECPYSLLLGAGASASSDIPVAEKLVSTWMQEIFCGIFNYDRPLDTSKFGHFEKWKREESRLFIDRLKHDLSAKTDYGALFEYTRKTRSERQMYIEHIVDGKSPGPGYFFLAGLMMGRFIDRVLTTNFDDMLEDALRRYYDGKPIVCGFDSAINSMNLGSIRPKLVKLHGDFLFDNIKNTDEEIVDLGDNMEKKMIEMCEDRGLIVIGYSGMDDSVMSPIYENMRKNKKFLTKGLHWCIHNDWIKKNCGSDEQLNTSKLPRKLQDLAERFPKRIFFYKIEGFDQFFEDTFGCVGLKHPKSITSPLESNRALDFLNACDNLQRLNGRISRGMSTHRSKTLDCINDARPGNELKMINANHLWNQASILINEGNSADAIHLLNQSVMISKEVQDSMDHVSPVYIDSFCRQIGCLIDIAKIQYQSNLDWKKALEDAKFIISEYDKISINYSDTGQMEKHIFTIYNILCTIGLDVSFNDKPPESERDMIIKLIGVMKSHPYGWERYERLLKDDDVKSVLKFIL